MKFSGMVKPIRNYFSLRVLSSSNDEDVYAEFILSEYWPGDKEKAEKDKLDYKVSNYKIKLIPTEEYKKLVGNENFYTSDFISLINRTKSFKQI